MATIEKRITPNGKIAYRVKVRLQGVKDSETFPSKAEAKRWGQKREAEIHEGKHLKDAGKDTLRETIERYIEKVLPTKPRSAKSQYHQLIWWRDNLGDELLAKITPKDIGEMRDKLAATRGPATTHHYLMALSHVFTMAVNEWGLIENSPFPKVKKPKLPGGRVRYLSDDERARLLKACKESSNPYLYTIVVLALSTGARKMELLGLRWRDIDLSRGVITLDQTKNGQRRALPLAGHALELMKAHAEARGASPNDLVFPNHAGTKPLDIHYPWIEALKQAGITNFKMHDCRHSAASYLAMSGASLIELAEVLGHKSLSMVRRYSHLSEAHTSKVVAAMNEKIFQGIN